MGAIRNVIQNSDVAQEERADLQAQLDIMAEFAETKADLFHMKLDEDIRNAGSEANRSVPVASVVARERWTHAYRANVADHISTEVGSALGQIIQGEKGKSFDAVSNLLSVSIKGFLGDGMGEEKMLYKYYVVSVEKSLLRIDIMAWSRKIKTTGLSQQIEKFCAFVGFASVVDLSKLPFSTFYYYYGRQLRDGQLDQDEVREELEYARELYSYHNQPINENLPVKSLSFAPGQTLPML